MIQQNEASEEDWEFEIKEDEDGAGQPGRSELEMDLAAFLFFASRFVSVTRSSFSLSLRPILKAI